MVLALQGDEVDFVEHFSVSGGKALLDDPNVQVIAVKTATHRQLHMRTDKEPFTDKRVRQAIALSIDRQALVDGLWEGQADIGNDSPFAPVYPSTDTSRARSASRTSSRRSSSSPTRAWATASRCELDTWNGFEIPDLAQLIKNYAAQIGVTINLKITDAATYYGDGVFGKSTVARLGHGHHRLRPPPGPERLPHRVRSRAIRRSASGTRRTSRTTSTTRSCGDYVAALDLDSPAGRREADPGAPARRDADHLPVLLLLPLGGEAEPAGSGLGGDRASSTSRRPASPAERSTENARPGLTGSGRLRL